MSFDVGTRCWVPDKEEGWIGAEVTAHEVAGDGNHVLKLMLEDGRIHEIKAKDLNDESDPKLPALRNPPILEATEDLTSLSYLNEPAVLHAIKQRYSQLNIYTYSGIVLIATNPFDRIDQLYSQDMVQAYAGKNRGEMEPHLFAIAEEAFRLMKTNSQNQTIIVSGESGAGKTVSAKYIMRYFASVEEGNSLTVQHQVEMSETEQRILATNPIMEAFGNAKTTRNDNSSRFGKYLEILFNKESSIIGARIRTYLLERSRLVYQPPSERNYHIFYQLLAGLSPKIKEQLHLTAGDDYYYMNQGGETKIAGVDDAKEFTITMDALSLVGIDEEYQQQIFKILAALLHMGNIEIKKTRNDASVSSEEPNLLIACELLGIDSYQFTKWIVKKQIITRSEKIVSNLSYNQALVARDSVAKFVYSALFDWLVENINTVLCNPNVSSSINTFIGVLDIYGFEHFEKNSFEQFCINYANEKLQQEFNQHVFKLEQEEYVSEEIEWTFIEFNDNQPCIDLIENKVGILALLDEESRLPAGSDESWTQKLYQTLDKPPTNKAFSKPRFGQNKFVVSHYALDVSYDVEGFIEKNRDTVSEGHLEVLKSSKNDTLIKILDNLDQVAKKLEEAKKSELESETRLKPGPLRANNKKPTLGSMFKQSLIELMSTIRSTNVHYIRCIKPNNDKEPWRFDNQMVLSQLRACGVLETIRISCVGFPSRWTFNEFVLRYYILISPSEWSSIFNSQNTTEDDVIAVCKKILAATVDDEGKYQIGKTKVFFKAGMLANFEKMRGDKMHSASTLIQKNIKGRYFRKWYLETIKSIHDLQIWSRSVVVRKVAHREIKNRASVLIQSHCKGVNTRTKITNILNSIKMIQVLVKNGLNKKKKLKEHENDAALRIQSKIRTAKPRQAFLKTRRDTIVVQSLIRRRKAQAIVKKLKEEAKSVKNLREVSYKLENKVIELTQSLALKTKENRDLTSRIEALQAQLLESKGLQNVLESAKLEHSKALEQRDSEFKLQRSELDSKIENAESKIAEITSELESLRSEYEGLKKSSHEDLLALDHVKSQLVESQVLNTDLQAEVNSLKEEIARLQVALSTNTVMTSVVPHTPSREPRSVSGANQTRNADSNQSTNILPHDLEQVPSIDVGSENPADQISQLNEELYRLLEETTTLDDEINKGLLKGFEIPDSGVASQLNRRDVVYPARILIIILSEMWRFGLTNRSESFLAKVLTTIQSVITQLKAPQLISAGAFWLANVRELYSFVIFAHHSILTEETFKNDMTEGEFADYVSLVTELREDCETLSYNIYNIWLKRLQKQLSKSAVGAVVLSQSLPGFSVDEPSGIITKFFNSNETYTMDDILTFFNNIYWAMKAYMIEREVFQAVVTTLLKYIDAYCFNDLIMRRNYLSWKRGIQLNYNVTRLEEWCKSHDVPEGSNCLKHLIQTAKLLQVRKHTVKDIDSLRDICDSLTATQLQKLISQYQIADYEGPISQEVLAYLANFVKNEANVSQNGKPLGHHSDIFIPLETGPFEDPFTKIETRTFDQVEAYIPDWLNLPCTKRIVDLVTQHVADMTGSTL